eukprot:Sspe_Gene.17903::Locus_6397_Transcript_1_1_Confidence_1.000_Length_1106::g.17903::m.17903/K01517/ADPRM; manganese-dependent ADP-ribose/CDP-alcohol diphosphatase
MRRVLVAAVVGAAGWSSSAVYASGPSPCFTIGAIADVQYADQDDQLSFAKTHMRRYRGALESLELAVKDWCRSNVDFVVDLGDIIDQVNETKGVSADVLARVLRVFEPLTVPVLHLVGNHELYNFTREELAPVWARDGRFYYSFAPAKGWRVVVLDPYEVNCIRGTEEEKERAFRILETINPNDVRAVRGTVNWSSGMVGLDRRMVPFNGAVGDEQLAWFGKQLKECEREGERVLVFTHVPLAPGSAADATLVWNHHSLLGLMNQHPCVAAVVAGHDHSGGYTTLRGVHHLTLPSPLHTSPETPEAHAILEVYEDRIKVIGKGIVPSRDLVLPPIPSRA